MVLVEVALSAVDEDPNLGRLPTGDPRLLQREHHVAVGRVNSLAAFLTCTCTDAHAGSTLRLPSRLRAERRWPA
jgi:hypothetical protein